ncbi:MAG: acyl-CoA dehydrogenase family protein [Myxococcales bacterium]|nr:acyl-CoA dehydrogenase family protein [Myxococcales bacterium]
MIDYSAIDRAIGQNWFAADPNLKLQIERYVGEADRAAAIERLQQVGAQMGGVIAENADVIDREPPVLRRYSREGDEINAVDHPAAGADSRRILWRLGLRYGARGELAPAAYLALRYMLAQADTGLLCAMGMTESVAELIERYGDSSTCEALLPKMRVAEWDEGHTGSMFITERAGGSDVGAAETVARLGDDGRWRLSGLKWFCSNVDGDVIATVARPEGAPAGVKGVALFAVPRRRSDGSDNGVHIRRIKSKLGTRSVPTGEVELDGAEAYLLAGADGDALDGRGVRRLMDMITDSRLGVALMGAGIARRAFFEAAIYASRRQAFGRRLVDHGMVREQLLMMQSEVEGCAAMLFACGELAAGERRGDLSDEQRGLSRMLVPLTKARTCRRGIDVASAALEIYGGNGYINDWPMARQYRDAQCHTIWEGTENILALDVLRALKRDAGPPFVAALSRTARAVGEAGPACAPLAKALAAGVGQIGEVFGWAASADVAQVMTRARRIADLLADVVQVSMLAEEALFELEARGNARKAVLATWLARQRIAAQPLRGITSNDRILDEGFEPLLRYGEISADAAAKLYGA